MSIIYVGFWGGESLDTLVDGFDTAGNYVFGTGWSAVTSPKYTGAGAMRCTVDNAQGRPPPSGQCSTSYITASQVVVTQSGTPATAYALLASAQFLINTPALEVGTDSKVRIVKSTANDNWAARSAISDWSATALAEDDSTFHIVTLFLDPLTLGTSHFWGVLAIDGAVEWEGDCGALATAYLYACEPVADADIDVTIDDAVVLRSDSSGDAPHLTDWPIPEVYRQLAIGETSADSWWKDAAKNNAEYTEWDDASGNDGDTTYNWQDASAGTNKYQRSDGQTAATVGIGFHTVIQGPVVIGTTGPVINIIHRIVAGGTKYAGAISIAGIGTQTEDPGVPGITYEGWACRIYRSSGTWTVSDLATIEFGVGIPDGAEHDQAWRVTLCMLQWCVYDTTYDHTDFATPGGETVTPSSPQQGATLAGMSPGIFF